MPPKKRKVSEERALPPPTPIVANEKGHGPPRTIKTVQIGKFEIDTWYFSPYPQEFHETETQALFHCAFCLKYFKSNRVLSRHCTKCGDKHPPGDEVYRKDDISVFEVDGGQQKVYCQNLCLLSKLFLDHKTLYYDVQPFLFYILCRVGPMGCQFIGYFSKEKQSPDIFNLACIMVLPPYQRGPERYGRFLIAFSYLLSQKENTLGSPERPLSDLGLVTYSSYWSDVIVNLLSNIDGDIIEMAEMCKQTGILPTDIVFTMQRLHLVKQAKGQNVVCFSKKIVNQIATERAKKPPGIQIDPAALHWAPLLPKEDN